MTKEQLKNKLQEYIITLIFACYSLVAGSILYTYSVETKANRVIAVEAKLDLILNHFGITKK